MKLRLLLSCLGALAVASPLYSAQLWAPGVYYDAETGKSGGWVDYDKEKKGSPWDDTLMCWAATASNILKWWQTQNADSLTSTSVPQEPWDVFRAVYGNVGSTPSYGLEWYIDGKKGGDWGDYVPPTGYDETGFNSIQDALPEKERNYDWPYGHFINTVNANNSVNVVYNTEDNPIFLFDNYNNVEGGGREMTLAILDAMEKGYALGLSVFNEAGNSGVAHAITLWGVEYEGEGDNRAITTMWITDSDNADGDGLQSYTLYNLNGVDSEGNPMKQNSLAFSSGTFKSATIGYVAGMRSDRVPEPATATLSLLALAGMALRRRRR